MNTTVYKNASIVTGISVAERFLGFLYRIVLSRYIGAEGLGLYQVALSLFSLLQTLGTGGLPVTVSRMVASGNAEDEKQKSAVLSAGLVCALCLSLPFCLLLWAFGEKMPFLFSGGEGFSVLRILLLGLCFACAYAVIRGYLWGNKRFLAASLLEMSEEVTMVLLGVFLLRGVPSPTVGAERAAWALAVADILSCIFAVAVLLCSGSKLSKPSGKIKPLFSAALPVTSVRASSSLVSSAVAVLLPAMLVRAGASESQALSLFGIVSGMVLPVLFIPATLIGSLALVLVPELSADYHQKNGERLKKNIARGLRFSFLVACALIPLFFVLGEEVGRVAFSSVEAGEIISKSCVILLPMSVTMISTSMLNSIGFEKQTLLFFFIGAAGLLCCVLALPPVCGVYAYPVGLGASYTLTALCSLVYLQKKLSINQKSRGQVSVHALFIPFIGILPLSVFGQLCLALSRRFLGAWSGTAATALLLALATLLFYALTRQIPLPKRKRRKNEEIS